MQRGSSSFRWCVLFNRLAVKPDQSDRFAELYGHADGRYEQISRGQVDQENVRYAVDNKTKYGSVATNDRYRQCVEHVLALMGFVRHEIGSLIGFELSLVIESSDLKPPTTARPAETDYFVLFEAPTFHFIYVKISFVNSLLGQTFAEERKTLMMPNITVVHSLHKQTDEIDAMNIESARGDVTRTRSLSAIELRLLDIGLASRFARRTILGHS
ncbi:hypothetical protein EVAR_98001_1 [Eumeta japonica]|uniref:Uncharacterized protein n=1 Tax=Eumeta variegata TaxID=151549 RepID=A0A4C1WM05_EUMVA|nr:hypothetical protein EVAR_98001_1 [Eumeta japonica]